MAPERSFSDFDSTRPAAKDPCPSAEALEMAAAKEAACLNTETRNSFQCPILALPGEIRNMIYDFCVEPKPLHLSHRDNNWLCPIRKFFGLTQVCRQIREEFRPLWMKGTELWVMPVDMDFFMKAFFSSGNSVGNVVIDLSDLTYLGIDAETLYYFQIVDILPLIKLRASSPNLDIRFAHLDGPSRWTCTLECEELNHLFLNGDLPLLRQYLNDAAARVMLDNSNYDYLDISIYIKPEYSEPWMARARWDLETEVQRAQRRAWEQQLGIPESSKLLIFTHGKYVEGHQDNTEDSEADTVDTNDE